MNQLILLNLLPYRFILFGHGVEGSLVFTSQAEILDHAYIYVYNLQIDTSKYGFASGMFLQIVSVSSHIVIFHL